MRKASRKANQIESKVRALAEIKVNGTQDERQYARNKLADGLSGRFQHKQRGLSTVKSTVKVPQYRKDNMRPTIPAVY